MKKFFLIAALLLCPLFGRTQVATTGYHRVNQVLTRAPQSIVANVVPNAKIAVTNTATGVAATIYSDPLLTSVINPPLLTADNSGNYSYYVALNYCVTETISTPGQSQPIVIPNICANSSGGTVLGLDANGTPVTPAAGVFNFTATGPIVLTPSGNTFNFSCPSCGSSSGGTSVSLNGGSPLANLNLNALTPTADTSFLALTPKSSGANAIIEAPYAGGSQYGVTILAAGGANPWLGYTPAQVFTLTTLGTSGQATYSSNIINIPQYQRALTLTTVGGSGPSTLSAGTLNIPQYTGGSGSAISVTSRTAPSSISGSQQAYDPIPSITPVCDIRTQGANINGTSDIGPAVQACVNLINSLYGGTGAVFLPCVGPSGSAGCYWANPGALTGPPSGSVILVGQGSVKCGSTCTMNGFISRIQGDGGGSVLQFEDGDPFSFIGPQAYGSLITAIPTPNVATSINIGFGGGTLTNLPVGSAITIAGKVSSAATATRVFNSTTSGYGLVTLALASPIRIPGGENITVTCTGAGSDSSFNITGGTSVQVDYTAQTLSYFQNDTTPSTSAGCTVTGPNQDSFESARILCSNGVSGTFNGPSGPVTYTCSTGQVTIMTKHAHVGIDLWGEVVAGPSFNNFGNQVWDQVNFNSCQGACFWAEGSTNLTLHQVAAQADATPTSVAGEFSANYLSYFHDVDFQATGPSGVEPGGGGGAVSNPYAIICDTDVPIAGYYSYTVSACDGTAIDENSWTIGGILLTSDNSGSQITGMPTTTSVKMERTWTAGITIDNRNGIGNNNALTLTNPYLQDNFSDSPQSLLFYTDAEPPSGLVEIDNNTVAATTLSVNNHFNGRVTFRGLSQGQTAVVPENLNAPSPCSDESGLFKCDIENKSEDFGPAVVPFGSLQMTTYTVAALNSLCASAGCTATAIVGPDSPSGQMLAFEMQTASTGADITTGSDTRATYAGDAYILFSHVRPGLNNSFTTGLINGVIGNNNSFYISAGSAIDFAPSSGTNGDLHVCSPGAFGTQQENNGWGSEVAICKITTGTSTPNAITFHLTASNGAVTGTRGNQYAEFGWAFIPGPNNPACTAAGTCNLTNDQIELARRDQYHGFVPPNMAAGVAVTGEQVIGSSFGVLSGTKAIYRCSGGTSDGYLVVASSTQATACTTGGGTLVLTGITTL